MSDFRGIGGVSVTLQTLLADRMELPDGLLTMPPVTIGPPAFSSQDNDPRREDPRVNLFLYRVTENGYLQNQDIPGRGAPGAFGHPPLSLNLHYLITAYGNETVPATGAGPALFDDRLAHFLLGSAMRVFHDIPVVTERITTVRPPSGGFVLHDSLRDEYEQVKLTLEPLTLEDVTKVWTALALRYRLSAAYAVTVVQIESRRPRRFPRPVGQPISPTTPPLPTDPPSPGPMVYVFTIQTPTVTEIRVRRLGETTEQTFPYARIGDTLILLGTSLGSAATTVEIGDLRVPATLSRGDRVEVDLPDATILGVGPIPPEQQLQPSVRTARVVLRDPLVPQSATPSNEAAFMLVPFVDPNPASIVYAGGPPRTVAVSGSRLLPDTPGGETVIGRSVVPRAAYLAATPTSLTVPLPDSLPTRDARVLVSSPLPDPVVLGPAAQTLDITIAGTTRSVTAHLPTSIARAAVAGILASLIHDAGVLPAPAPPDPLFLGARVDLWNNRLYVVPGGLTHTVAITSPGPSTFAGDLGLTAPQPPGAGSALLSGELSSPLPFSSRNPHLTMQVGAQPPITVTVSPTTTLAALAAALQTAINGASALPAYLNAVVVTSGTQLLVIPGIAGLVVFAPAPGDDTTAGELQLHARFAIRVRVNGAESIDPATLELPQ